MKAKIFLFSFVILTTTYLNGQIESVFDRINGVKLKNEIFIRWDEGQKIFKYAIEDINLWHKIDDNLIFNIKNNTRNDFQVYIEFYNPLKYSIKSDIKDLEDPAYQVITQFLSSLPVLPSAMPVSSSQTAPAYSIVTKNETGDSIFANLEQLTIINEWLYQFSQAIDTSATKDENKSKKFNDLIAKINSIKDTDDYLFGNIFIQIPEYSNLEYSVGNWIKFRNDIHYNNNNNYEQYKIDLESSRKILEQLKVKRDKAKSDIGIIINMLSSDYEVNINEFILANKRNEFKKYSAGTSAWLSVNTMVTLESNNKLIEVFEAYISKLEAHVSKFIKSRTEYGTIKYYFQLSDLRLGWETQVMKMFENEIISLDKDGVEIAKSNIKGDFIVSKRIGLYPFISTGVLYTGVSYPNYAISTSNGMNFVGKAPDSRAYIRPALFLNMLISSWDPIYPFFQIGVSTGVDSAIFPVGFGFAIGKSFSLSGGAMLGYRKDLDKLKVGDPVKDDEALQNDLIYKGFVSGYFSINYNLGKK